MALSPGGDSSERWPGARAFPYFTPVISMLRFHLFALLSTAVLAAAFPLSAAPALPEKPNIIFILSDDLAQGDVGCYGQKLIQTPRLDRMAAEGVKYTQAYCGTSVCAPSRASLMTGRHSGHSPIRANWEIAPGEGQYPLPEKQVIIPEILKTRGYATACTGKWGMGMFDTTGSPLKQGFDFFFGYNCQRHAHSYFPTHLYRNDQRIELPGNDGKGIGKTYAQNLIADETLAWVRQQKDKPFFLFYAITLPHARNEIDDLGIYKDKPWSDQQKAYAAMVTRLDTDVGRLLDLLQELGIDDRTLVMISGDNGSSYPPTSEVGKLFNQASNGLRGFKRGLYEGALRQASIARWPGVIPAGATRDEPWAFWDFLPTAAKLAGAELPAGETFDGYSLVDFLRGGPAPKREVFYWELHEGKPIQAVRFGKWKAVKNGPNAKVELYDLDKDPGESNDLAASHEEVVQKAVAYMASQRTAHPDWPLDKSRPKGAKPGGAGGK
jgi:arylsulfatase A-like enzyme